MHFSPSIYQNFSLESGSQNSYNKDKSAGKIVNFCLIAVFRPADSDARAQHAPTNEGMRRKSSCANELCPCFWQWPWSWACLWAPPRPPAAPTDLNRYLLSHTSRSGETRPLPIDRTEVNEHPVIGYYTYTFQDGEAAGRSFKLYVGQHAALRAYITVIALPDGIADPYAFLQEQGWLEQADTYGELLFVLEPGQGGWGTLTARPPIWRPAWAR